MGKDTADLVDYWHRISKNSHLSQAMSDEDTCMQNRVKRIPSAGAKVLTRKQAWCAWWKGKQPGASAGMKRAGNEQRWGLVGNTLL